MIRVSFTHRTYQMVLAMSVLLLLVSSGLGMANESKSLKFQAIADYDLDNVSIPGISCSVGNISGAVSVYSSESKFFAVDDQLTLFCTLCNRSDDGKGKVAGVCSLKDNKGSEFGLDVARDISPNGGGRGTARVIGVSGPYAKLSGTCSYDIRFLKNAQIKRDFMISDWDCQVSE